MPATVSVTLEDLVEETLDSLYRANERPARVIVGSNALDNAADTTFTLSTGTLSITDRVEGPLGELMLVTAKSEDATPVYTVARGYQNTTAAGGHATNAVLLKNPLYGRAEVIRWINRCVSSFMNAKLPYVEVNTYTVDSTDQWVELPADTLEVLRVRRYNEVTNDMDTLSAWQYQEVPTTVATSGKVLMTPKTVDNDDSLIVDVWLPYEFSDATEAGTISLPVAAQDLPVLWATAYALSRRQVSRTELDKIEEWNQDQAIRAGVSLRAVRDTWGEVYRRVDEAKELHRLPRNRPYRKMR